MWPQIKQTLHMPFKSMSIYIFGEGELNGTRLQFDKITLPPGAIWGGMKFREGQQICIEPPHPSHAVLLMNDRSVAILKIRFNYQDTEHKLKLYIGSEEQSSHTEMQAGPATVVISRKTENSVWFLLKKSTNVVSLHAHQNKKRLLYRRTFN